LPQDLLRLGRVFVTQIGGFAHNVHHLGLLLNEIEVEQLIGGHLEKSGNGGNHGHIRHAGSGLPLAHRLKGNTQHLCQHLL